METKEIKKTAYGHFESGLHCAEVISKTVLEMFSHEPHGEVIRAASAFGGGIAGSTEELCGAFTGGVIALGSLLGRNKPGEDLRECGRLTKDFKSRFEAEFGSLSCPTILNRFSQEAHPARCAKLTAQASVMLAELLNGAETEKEAKVDVVCCQPRDQAAIGACPFGCF